MDIIDIIAWKYLTLDRILAILYLTGKNLYNQLLEVFWEDVYQTQAFMRGA